MDDRATEKKERLLAALDRGMAMIHLDARRPGVVVPPELKTESHLRLNLSYKFHPPDLTVGDWGLRSTLSFSGKQFAVAVPWSALFGIASHATDEFWLYPEDIPPELTQAPAQRPATASPESAKPLTARKVALREVAGEREGDAEPAKDEAPRSRGHLRVVK